MQNARKQFHNYTAQGELRFEMLEDELHFFNAVNEKRFEQVKLLRNFCIDPTADPSKLKKKLKESDANLDEFVEEEAEKAGEVRNKLQSLRERAAMLRDRNKGKEPMSVEEMERLVNKKMTAFTDQLQRAN
jgi:hypothetical protein